MVKTKVQPLKDFDSDSTSEEELWGKQILKSIFHIGTNSFTSGEKEFIDLRYKDVAFYVYKNPTVELITQFSSSFLIMKAPANNRQSTIFTPRNAVRIKYKTYKVDEDDASSSAMELTGADNPLPTKKLKSSGQLPLNKNYSNYSTNSVRRKRSPIEIKAAPGLLDLHDKLSPVRKGSNHSEDARKPNRRLAGCSVS